MDPLFWFCFLLTYLPVSESIVKTHCLTQPSGDIEQRTGYPAVLQCTVSANCSNTGVHYEWFVLKEKQRHHLNLNSNPDKYALEEASLHIKSLHVNDSGIYYCAATWPGLPTHGQQYVGSGTTLVVRGQPMLRYILMWLLFVLLAIYSLVIVTLIILKKFGCNVRCKGMRQTDQDKSPKKATRRTQFHDVLEEMYTKKNLVKKKRTAGRNLNQPEAAFTDVDSSNDDIYQNA